MRDGRRVPTRPRARALRIVALLAVLFGVLVAVLPREPCVDLPVAAAVAARDSTSVAAVAASSEEAPAADRGRAAALPSVGAAAPARASSRLAGSWARQEAPRPIAGASIEPLIERLYLRIRVFRT